MEILIKTYKENGDFTLEQKDYFFDKPKQEVLDMILNSDDPQFRKTCVLSFLDCNSLENIQNSYSEFIRQEVVVDAIRSIKNDIRQSIQNTDEKN